MLFKNLEIFGFKSFAKKTRLDFEPGVTAIVGPNGCGKSNLADAIKWVMGEQSVQSMRGTTMEDVIFHGTDDMPPIGFAEVSLTVSNQGKHFPLDYEEITLTRRIFRSGESEYILNKVPVRLKDIQELLMGTGLGISSYSVMEQGKVDQILSSRPQDRREIFEEAAGITKYKSKREEALRKLERTGENLQRIGDIIVEVKRQIKSMERQVNKALRYKEEYEKLKEYELKVAQYQYQTFKKEKETLAVQVQEQKRQEEALNAELNSTVRTLEEVRQTLSSLEQDITQIQKQGYEVCATLRTEENKITLNQERVEELTARKDELQLVLQGLENKITETVQSIAAGEEELKVIEQNRQQASSSLAKKEGNVEQILAQISDRQKAIPEDKAKELEIIAQETKLKNDLTKLEANLANFQARLRRLQVEQKTSEAELNNIEGRYRLCRSDQETLAAQFNQLKREIWDLKSGLNINLENGEALTRHLDETGRTITQQQSALNFLQEITERYEGYSSGVKSILAAKNNRELKIEGLRGTVAELIEVLPEYELPIEAALGESAQAIVVETRQDARLAIGYLKEKGTGRANFICLDKVARHQAAEIVLSSALGRAQDFIKIQPQYQKLLAYLLAGVHLVQNLAVAEEIVKEARDASLKLVTLEGEIFTRQSMTGGKLIKDAQTGLLGRQRKMEAITAELAKLSAERDRLQGLKNVQEAEIDRLRQLVKEKEPGLDELKIKLASKETERASIETDKKRFNDEVSVLSLELDEANSEISRLLQDEQGLKQKLAQEQDRYKEIRNALQGHQDFIAQNHQERQNTLVEIAELKAGFSALDRQAQEAKRRIQLFADAEGEQRNTQAARSQEVQDIGTKITGLQQEIQQLRAHTQELSQKKSELEKQTRDAQQKRSSLCETIQELGQKVRNSQRQLDEARRTWTNYQMKLTELGYKQDSLKEKMQQSYSVDLDASLENVLEISPPHDSIFAEINQLKERLEEIGPVNLVAIDENEQLQQRYSFLILQQEDLCNAQESLRKAIVQINRTARDMFSETFQKIQVSFKEYFRILFGGGDARLILLEENNILESGIEIVVRPPGKRLQNISLLSGGEKALTAIALLFAIFKVKPSPFCILDEVDAALDEPNIDRFINLLSEFIKTSQFIIITHNKKTIYMADIMYGITMEKSGISKIVSVRLSEPKEEAPAPEMTSVAQ